MCTHKSKATAMEASLLDIKCAKFGDLKTYFQISKAADVITVDEKVFVRV